MTALESFQNYRPLLFSIAYRMLGSAMEAEDMVQETWLRYEATQPGSIRDLKAFLTTIVTRLCLNQLDAARVKREAYVGPWLPEPLLTAEAPGPSPLDQAVQDESISVAFLVLLESLTPVERAVFILRHVFDYEYAEIADIVGKDQVACRQLFSRAQKHIADHRSRFKTTPEQHRRVLEQFHRTIMAGEIDGLEKMLADDVTLWADGGGKAKGAATQPLHGRDAVVRFLVASRRLRTEEARFETSIVNGEWSLVLRVHEQALLVVFVELEGEHIREIRMIGNPDKLQWI